VLRPPRMPRWGLRLPGQDSRDSHLGPPDAAPTPTELPSHFPAASKIDSRRTPEREVESAKVLIDVAEQNAETTSKTAGNRQNTAKVVPRGLPVHASSMAQPPKPGAKQDRKHSTYVAGSFLEKSRGAHSQSASDIGHSEIASSAASEVAQLRPRRHPRERTTAETTAAQSFSAHSNLPEPAAELVSHAQIKSGSMMPEEHQFADSEVRDQHLFRDAIPVLRAITTAPVPIKQPDTKPSGNSIHIENVDIHIVPPPAPAFLVQQGVRQRGAVAAMARGFTSSFGLNQG